MVHRPSRRAFIRDTGAGLLAFTSGSLCLLLTPAEARERELPLRVLSAEQARTLEALGEVLLPGSTDAGLAHFVDHQLGAAPAAQLLMIRYLGVEPPFTAFYTDSLAALDACSLAAWGVPFHAAEPGQRLELTGRLAQANPDGWSGPPAPLFYFVLRSDALDVVYGTRAGVERLGLPYMAHIEPPSRWGE